MPPTHDDLIARIVKAEAAIKEAIATAERVLGRVSALETWKREMVSSEDRRRDEQAHALSTMTDAAKAAFERMMRDAAAQVTESVAEELAKAAPMLAKLPDLFAMNERQTVLAEEARTERINRRQREKESELVLKTREQDRQQSLLDLEVEKHRAEAANKKWQIRLAIILPIITILGGLIATAVASHQTPSTAPPASSSPH